MGNRANWTEDDFRAEQNEAKTEVWPPAALPSELAKVLIGDMHAMPDELSDLVEIFQKQIPVRGDI